VRQQHKFDLSLKFTKNSAQLEVEEEPYLRISDIISDKKVYLVSNQEEKEVLIELIMKKNGKQV
jgi:hypothetical protein